MIYFSKDNKDYVHMRKYYIDNIRLLVILLLIPYHAAQAFNTWGELNYFFFYPNKLISSFIVFCSPFYMPIMFLLAGISTRYALKKRTYGQFIGERIKRLIFPLVFGTLFFCPILACIGDKTNCGYYVLSSDIVLENIEKYRYVSLGVGLVAGITNVYMFIWSGTDYGTFNMIAKAFTEWFMILAVMGIGKHIMNHSGKVLEYLSKRSFFFSAFILYGLCCFSIGCRIS